MPAPVLGYLHLMSYPIPVIVGMKKLSALSKPMRVLTGLCILTCVNIAAQFVLSLFKVTNYFLGEYYTPIEVCLLCAVFYFSVASKGVQLVLTILGGFFIMIWVGNMIWFYDSRHIDSGMAVISRVFLIAISLITLQVTMKDERSRLVERSVFWVVLGVVLYSCGTLLVVGLSNELIKLGETYFIIAWHVNWSLLVITNLLYTKAILCKSPV